MLRKLILFAITSGLAKKAFDKLTQRNRGAASHQPVGRSRARKPGDAQAASRTASRRTTRTSAG